MVVTGRCSSDTHYVSRNYKTAYRDTLAESEALLASSLILFSTQGWQLIRDCSVVELRIIRLVD